MPYFCKTLFERGAQMPGAVLGDFMLDGDGVLSGWAFAPGQPGLRLAVEILLNGEVVASLVAASFREDLRAQRIGDGYHGFTVTLTRQIAAAGKPVMISARIRGGGVFWQKILGDFKVSEDFEARVAALRAGINEAANAPALRPAVDLPELFRRLGQRLLEQGGD